MPATRHRRTVRQREDALIARAESVLLRRLRRLDRIDDSRQAEAFLRMRLAGLAREQLHALWLDQHYRVIACDMIAAGSIDRANVEARVVLQTALERNARHAILAHNHPSGDCTPSASDVLLTEDLRSTLRMIDVELLDHLVIGACASYSFNECRALATSAAARPRRLP